ncbi:MAG: hypothetical protein ACE5GN_00940 [Waddliaceae bacterium]
MTHPLQAAYDGVKDHPFHTLTREILADEEDMGKLNARLEPLAQWLLEIGSVFKGRCPDECVKLKERITELQKNDIFFDKCTEDSQEELFPLYAMFAAYSFDLALDKSQMVSEQDKKAFEMGPEVCKAMNQLERSLENREKSEKVDRLFLAFSERFREFVEVLSEA